MGYIDKVYVKDGKRYISIDYAEMLTGRGQRTPPPSRPARSRRASTCPNDYWISNDEPAETGVRGLRPVAITTSTRWVPGEDMGRAVHVGRVQELLGPGAASPESETHLHEVPWWIERDGPLVVKIDEQYLP